MPPSYDVVPPTASADLADVRIATWGAVVCVADSVDGLP